MKDTREQEWKLPWRALLTRAGFPCNLQLFMLLDVRCRPSEWAKWTLAVQMDLIFVLMLWKWFLGEKFLSGLIFPNSYLFLRTYFALSSGYGYVNFIVDPVSLWCAMSSGENEWVSKTDLKLHRYKCCWILPSIYFFPLFLLCLFCYHCTVCLSIYILIDQVISLWNLLSILKSAQLHICLWYSLLLGMFYL